MKIWFTHVRGGVSRRSGIVLWLLGVYANGLGTARGVSVDDFAARWFTNAQGVLPYRLFIPTNYNAAERFPLVLFLHGLAGSAAALGQSVTGVFWTNFANNAKGVASGTNIWNVTNIPLVANRTNVVAVVATTTSWVPAYGGNTTFDDTLTVVCYPIRATLVLQGAEAILNWTGGGPPYRVQRATDLAVGDWTDYLTDTTPPVTLSLAGQAGFYRILGQ